MNLRHESGLGRVRGGVLRNLREGRALVNTAFTLVELLVTMAVLSIIALLLLSVTDSAFKLWRSTSTSITMFENARAAYDVMTRRISQATVNTYLDYYGSDWKRRNPATSGTFTPSFYGRASDLHFRSGAAAPLMGGQQQGHGIFFFAPLGFTDNNATYADLPNLLNACGYYVEWGADTNLRPSFLSNLPTRHRFRLMENFLPSQNFTNYPQFTDTIDNNDNLWITNGLKGANARRHALAENILALIIRPEVATQDATLMGFANAYNLTTDYEYDSRLGRDLGSPYDIQFAQLPPMLRVVMVAVDEAGAARLIGSSTSMPDAFKLNAAWFKDPAKLDEDLLAFSNQLTAARVQFRIFNQVIPLRGAKFSAQKEK